MFDARLYLTRFLVIVEVPVHRSVSFGHQKEHIARRLRCLAVLLRTVYACHFTSAPPQV
jgi:hypothetical protein